MTGSNLSLSRKAVTDSIVQAFANTVYPGDDNIVDSIPGSGPASGNPDRWDIWELACGKSWHELLEVLEAMTMKEYNAVNTNLVFFTPLGFAYYLPAFMIRTLRGDSNNVQRVVFGLLGDLTELFVDANRRLKSCLTDEQKKAITNFILYSVSIDPSWIIQYPGMIDNWTT